MRKSKFWTIVFSLLPGVGHMYLGLMQRGLQFSLIVAGLITLTIIIQFEVIAILGPIIWFYSLFDALQKADLIKQGQSVTDELLFPWNRLPINSRWTGWLLIIFGFIILVNNAVNFRDLLPNIAVLNFIFSNFSVILVSFFMIIFGVMLIRRNVRTVDN